MIDILHLIIALGLCLLIITSMIWLFVRSKEITTLEAKIEELESYIENETLYLTGEIETLHQNVNKEHTLSLIHI